MMILYKKNQFRLKEWKNVQNHAKNLPSKDRDAVFLPFLGEFGIKLCYHARFVHFFNNCRKKIVYCKPGDRYFYPSANEFIDFDESPYDLFQEKRFELTFADANYDRIYAKLLLELIQKHSECHFPIFKNGIFNLLKKTLSLPIQLKYSKIEISPKIDIAIATRHIKDSEYPNLACHIHLPPGIAHRNYPYWTQLVELLKKKYTIAIIGTEDTSIKVEGCLHSWEMDGQDNNLVSLNMLNQCRVFLGTDSGVMHLSCLVNTPSVLIKNPYEPHGLLRELKIINDKLIIIGNNYWHKPDRVVEYVINHLNKVD